VTSHLQQGLLRHRQRREDGDLGGHCQQRRGRLQRRPLLADPEGHQLHQRKHDQLSGARFTNYLNIILQLRILSLILVSTLPCVVKFIIILKLANSNLRMDS
jgi:hypothetical protein